MRRLKTIDTRILFTAGFSLFSAYILSFLFEGQILYSLVKLYAIDPPAYLVAAIAAEFVGLFSCGYLVKSQSGAKRTVTGSMVLCLLVTVPFFFAPSVFWIGGLIVGGCASGCAVASLGSFLKAFTAKNERITTCADILIYSNVIMIAINVLAIHVSPFVGLVLTLVCVLLGIACFWALPTCSQCGQERKEESNRRVNVTRPLLLLSLFVLIITINSGLMYQVINPAFEHLTGLVSWYWAVPYIVALIVMRNLPTRIKRSGALYVGMAMIMAAFISFMLLQRDAGAYLIVDTFMLGACGIFDLFWWSILAEMLDYTDNPVKVFGIGLSANVFGVLTGDLLGMKITSIHLPGAEVAVIALTVASATLVLLPILNRHLVMLLKSHAYLAVYDNMSKPEQSAVFAQTATLDPLTVREQEVLELLLDGKSNRQIAEELFISESTVKTHVRNVFSKYDVGSRAELISILLKHRIAE